MSFFPAVRNGTPGNRASGLLMLVFLTVLLAPLAGWGADAPEKLEKEDGTVVTGEVRGVSGSNVILFTPDEVALEIPLGELSETSRREVLEWVLPLVFSNERAFPFEVYRKMRSSEGASAEGGFEVVFENRSQMDLPPDMRLELVVHRLDFDLFWGVGEQKSYRLTGGRPEPTEVPFEGLPSGGEGTFVVQSVTFPSADRGPGWADLVAGVFPANEPPETLTKAFLEIRFLFADQEVGSFVESATAAGALARLSGEDGSVVAPKPVAVGFAPPEPSSMRVPIESLVIITSNTSTGSGFLARLRGRTFLITNAHVIAGKLSITARTVEGRTITLPQHCFLSRDRDLALIPVEDEGSFLEVAEDLSGLTIGDAITVFGNEAGALVATELRGRVRGLGPEQVEIDARILEGNSGSPVIDDENEEVVGVVAYYIEYEIPEADREPPPSGEADEAESDGSEDDSSPGIVRRRFAERLDNAESWEKVSFTDLTREGTAFKAYQSLVTGVAQIAMHISKRGRIPTGGFESDELNQLVSRFHRQFSSSNRSGSTANARALSDLRHQLFSLVDSRKRMTGGQLYTTYFRNEFDRASEFSEKVRDFFEGVRTY